MDHLDHLDPCAREVQNDQRAQCHRYYGVIFDIGALRYSKSRSRTFAVGICLGRARENSEAVDIPHVSRYLILDMRKKVPPIRKVSLIGDDEGSRQVGIPRAEEGMQELLAEDEEEEMEEEVSAGGSDAMHGVQGNICSDWENSETPVGEFDRGPESDIALDLPTITGLWRRQEGPEEGGHLHPRPPISDKNIPEDRATAHIVIKPANSSPVSSATAVAAVSTGGAPWGSTSGSSFQQRTAQDWRHPSVKRQRSRKGGLTMISKIMLWR